MKELQQFDQPCGCLCRLGEADAMGELVLLQEMDKHERFYRGAANNHVFSQSVR